MSSMEISNLTIEALKEMFAKEKRFDERKLVDYRKIEVGEAVSNKAEGSARVKIGKTEVLVGVKLSPGEPYPDSPEKGNLAFSSELLPLASPRFESGPPKFEGIELSRLVDRSVRESGMIKLDKLVIKKGELVWTVFIDIYPLNDDGNLIDAANIAASIALRKAIVPKLGENNRADYEKESKEKLPIDEDIIPLSISFYKLGNSFIIDPTREEEEACETRITLGLSKWNGKYMINSCQKSGISPLTKEEIEKIMEILPKKYDELNEKLKKFF